MSVFNTLKNKIAFKSTVEDFYLNIEIVEIQWWLSWCNDYPDLYWARLRKFSNGRADVLFENENTSYGFENEKFAGYFISEDEFSRFENMDEVDRNNLKIPKDVLIETPTWINKEVKNFEYIGTY